MSEEIGLSYVQKLVQTNDDLIVNFSLYSSFMAQLNERKTENGELEFTEEESIHLRNLITAIKPQIFFINKKIKSLREHLNKLSPEDEKRFHEIFLELRDTSIPKVQSLDEFTDFTEKFIVGSAVNDIFENKVKKMNEMFKKDEK